MFAQGLMVCPVVNQISGDIIKELSESLIRCPKEKCSLNRIGSVSKEFMRLFQQLTWYQCFMKAREIL